MSNLRYVDYLKSKFDEVKNQGAEKDETIKRLEAVNDEFTSQIVRLGKEVDELGEKGSEKKPEGEASESKEGKLESKPKPQTKAKPKPQTKASPAPLRKKVLKVSFEKKKDEVNQVTGNQATENEFDSQDEGASQVTFGKGQEGSELPKESQSEKTAEPKVPVSESQSEKPAEPEVPFSVGS
jgi:hypothetical protein